MQRSIFFLINLSLIDSFMPYNHKQMYFSQEKTKNKKKLVYIKKVLIIITFNAYQFSETMLDSGG